MSEEDLKINARVRKIFVENNLDPSLLTISTASGSVLVRGEFQRLTSRELNDRDAVRLLSLLETIILRTKGVKRVVFSVQHWKKSKGKWTKEEK